MGHNPAFQFYPGDWFREPGLQRVDLDVRGAWAELLMMMHHETPRGVSTGSIAGLARQLRIEIPRACFIVEQLDVNRIAEVEYQDEDCRKFVYDCANYFQGLSLKCPEVSPECPVFVTLKNRRMVNEEKAKEYERLKKQKQRRPRDVHGNVPEMSRPLLHSPSPTPTPKEEIPCAVATAPHVSNGIGKQAREVLGWLNQKAHKNYRPSETNLDFIVNRLKDGIFDWQLKAIVTRKCREWDTDEMRKYLRPATLFNKTKCEQYLGELPKEASDGVS